MRLVRLEILPGRREVEREAFELLDVEGGERLESLRTHSGEREADDPVIVVVPDADHETGLDGAVDETDRAVVAEQEVVRHLADGRPSRVTVAADREQQLVLGRCEAGRLRLLLAPALESSQPGP